MSPRNPWPASALRGVVIHDHVPPATLRDTAAATADAYSEQPAERSDAIGINSRAGAERTQGKPTDVGARRLREHENLPTWIPTLSGQRVELLAPTPANIRMSDIAGALAKLPRWTGQTLLSLSIAQHSVWVSRQVTQLAAPYALLHDAHEAYINDLSSPFTAAVRTLLAAARCNADPIAAIKDRLDQAIFRAFGLQWPMPPHIAIAVKHADLVALATEKRDVAADHPAWAEVTLLPPSPQVIRPLSWDRAHAQFVTRFRELFGEAFQ